MDEQRVTLDREGDIPVLRFERSLAHSPAKVWKAITDPAEMAHWFPAAVHTELEPGAAMRFTFPDDAPVDTDGGRGEVLEFEPPKLYTFRWNDDVLRFELAPDGAGCRLLFSQTIGGGARGLGSAGHTAHGWLVCLGALDAWLAGHEAAMPTDWLGPREHFVAEFGLDQGEAVATADGYRVEFVRNLAWTPVDEVWALLVEDAELQVGGEAPPRATNGQVPAGVLTAVGAPTLLEYEWSHHGEPAGRVRWEIRHDPLLGTEVELTQTLPVRLAELRSTALAAWHVQLELFFAATHGVIRPWPAERATELERRYRERLRAPGRR